MTLIDAIGAVVTAMQASQTGQIIPPDASPFTIVDMTSTQYFFVGQRVRVVGTSPAYDEYGTVTEIVSDTRMKVSLPGSPVYGGSKPPSSTVTVSSVINYMYGHPVEIVNTFSEAAQNQTAHAGMFPAICLMLDVEEQMNAGGYASMSTPTIILVTLTKPEYKAANRKTNSFEATLYPMYEMFLKALRASPDLTIGDMAEHRKIDRFYWGAKGLYGNTGNMFNDFIDAIEINNIEIKIFKTC